MKPYLLESKCRTIPKWHCFHNWQLFIRKAHKNQLLYKGYMIQQVAYSQKNMKSFSYIYKLALTIQNFNTQ